MIRAGQFGWPKRDLSMVNTMENRNRALHSCHLHSRFGLAEKEKGNRVGLGWRLGMPKINVERQSVSPTEEKIAIESGRKF